VQYVKNGILVLTLVLLSLVTLWAVFWTVLFLANLLLGHGGGTIQIGPDG